MIEKVYNYKNADERIIEKIVDDDNVALNHMVLTKDTGLPEHYSNSNVYMIIVRGTMTLQLDEQEPIKYSVGDIINIPYKTKMNVNNFDNATLEFFVIKAPNPRNYRGE
ncbi:cupin domain-containing protein [Caldisalinibacter kiritimatiensis]|uniref:Cupin 2 conserved barrel domain-containing protein n=1 Tax=Caldisalinibacter kiritimatiensis TaxID=1304284 RepID=R1AV93_9FIRM|nr:cupin domain-containing protein [Caldisalinibacter kiritimatiensis]EOD01108.1 hypothetical protein L21TH_0819 [Caldisalinibacter kiritimatiensis]